MSAQCRLVKSPTIAWYGIGVIQFLLTFSNILILQWKCGPPWTDTHREQKGSADINSFHVLLLHIWSGFCCWLPPSILFNHILELSLNVWLSYPASSGKFGAFFASIPLPIFAAIYCVLFGIVGEWIWHYFCFDLIN